MRKALTAIILAATSLAQTGCGTEIKYVPLNAPPRPAQPREASQVEMFTTAKPDRPYVEVGMIESRQQSAWSGDDTAEVMHKMREDAGKRGCDGLIVIGSNDETQVSGSSSRNGGSVSSTTLKGYRATCIVYR